MSNNAAIDLQINPRANLPQASGSVAADVSLQLLVAECARPRAQKGSPASLSPYSAALATFRKLLRPRTGALRGNCPVFTEALRINVCQTRFEQYPFFIMQELKSLPAHLTGGNY